MKSQLITSPRAAAPGPVVRPQDPDDEETSEDRILHDDGLFQWMVLACSAFSVVVTTCHIHSFRLTARVMNHWCMPPENVSALTPVHWRNTSIPVEEDGSFSRCTMYDSSSSARNDSARKIVPCGSWYFDLAEYGNTVISEWSLVCERHWLVPLAFMVFTSGTVLCLPVLGMASDRRGRRPVACVCVVVLVITGFASAVTRSFLVFVAVRLAMSASASSLMTTLFVTLYEVVTPDKRVLYATINAALAFVLTPVIFVALSRLRLDWDKVHLVFMIPTPFLVAVFYVVPESPRWLLATWRFKAAERVALMAARINRTSLDRTRLSVYRAASRIQRSIYDHNAPPTIGIKGLLHQSKHRKNAVLLLYAWFAVDFAYSSIANTRHLVYYDWVPITFVLCTAPLFAGVFVCLSYFGRKRVTVTVTLLISIETTFLVLMYGDGRPTPSSGVVIVFLKLSCSAAFGAVFIFTLDLFPTVFRCIGVGTAFACGNVGTLCATLLTELETTTLRKDRLLSLIAILTTLGAVALQMLPDTAGAVLFSRSRKKTDREVEHTHTLAASLETPTSVSRRSSPLPGRTSMDSQTLCLPPGLERLSSQFISPGVHELSGGTFNRPKLERHGSTDGTRSELENDL